MKKAIVAIPVCGLLIAVISGFMITSSAQNSNSSTTTNKSTERTIGAPAPGTGAPRSRPQQDFSKNTWELPDDADKTKNPVAATPESISKGKELYLAQDKGNCIFCHGENGAGNEANLPRLRRKPGDLTNKERMSSMSDGELFWKITKGINGIMPAGERKMPEAEDRWHVVNYIKTLVKDK